MNGNVSLALSCGFPVQAPRQDTTMTHPERDKLIAQLDAMAQQRDTWKRMAETAAREMRTLMEIRVAGQQQVRDLTADRDNLQRALNATEELNRIEADDYETKIRDLTAARDAALNQVRAMAHPPHIHTSPEAIAKELAKIQAAIPHRNRDVHTDFPATALRRGDGLAR